MSQISKSDHIPLLQKLTFAAGANMDYIATGLMTGVLWMPFFNIGLGINPLLLGIVLMVLRAWDAMTDPIMGNISDNTRTRWGRRRPYLFVGAILTALMFPVLWYLPHGIQSGTSWLSSVAEWMPLIAQVDAPIEQKAATLYLMLIGIAFFSCFTLWSMPYYGLQLELTPSYDERTRLTAWMTFFSKISALIGSWLLAFVILVGTVALGEPTSSLNLPVWVQDLLSRLQPWLMQITAAEPDEKPIVVGMRVVCWLLAGSILLFGLLPALFVKERYYESEALITQKRDPFWKSIGESIRCAPLWSLISVSFFLVLGAMSVGSLGQYVNFYYVCHGDLAMGSLIAGIKGTVMVFSGIASIPLFTWLGERFDKRTMVLSMLGCSMFGHLLNYFLMTPEHPYWQIVPGVFESSAIAAVWLFLPSMKADVADWDEQKTHRRREGAINAFYSWFIKAAMTCSMGIGGAVLQLSGFNALLDSQPDDVVTRMFHIYLFLPLVIWAAAVIAIWLYPLTRERSVQIRLELETRRGAM